MSSSLQVDSSSIGQPGSGKDKLKSPRTPEKKSRTRSIRYMGSSSMPLDYAGTTVWVADESLIWIQAKVLSQKENILTIEKMNSGSGSGSNNNQKVTDIDLAFEEVHKINPKVVPDMAALKYINEPGILYNLTQRSLQLHPYTYMGTVMIAVNPLRELSIPAIKDYVDKPLNPETPHPYALAELSYQQLCFSNIDQCLVVSGESGAGKTETAKILLKFIADRSPYIADIEGSNKNPSVSSKITQNFDKRMLQSSPLLESFGNAKTGRNNNSSRFGKLLKMYFKQNSNSHIVNNKSNSLTPSMSNLKDKMGLVGVAIETYLLEKSRVVGMNEGERNYHIFYQILSAIQASNSLVSHLKQDNTETDPSKYRLLNQSNCYTFNGANDNENFQITHNSLLAFGFDIEEAKILYSIITGLLYMGNISFIDEETEAGDKGKVEDIIPLQIAAKKLGVSVEALNDLLTTRVLDIGGANATSASASSSVSNATVTTTTQQQKVRVRLSTKDAVYARDASIKAIYENVFGSIVRQINRNLSGDYGDLRKDTNLHFISILDIYGFETFEINSFEQFLINYANESLQNIFNSQIFEAELRLFAEENIMIKISSQPENNGCIELIAARNNSILSTLDLVSQLPKPTDERFVEELHKTLNKHRYFPPVHIKEKHNTFYVKHFAGKIKYTVGNVDNTTTNGNNSGANSPVSKSPLKPATTSTNNNNKGFESYTWVSKNNDASPDELSNFCDNSTMSEMRALYSHLKNNSNNSGGTEENTTGTVNPKRRRSLVPSTAATKPTSATTNTTAVTTSYQDAKNQLIKPTIATTFSNSMFDLSTLLVATNCLFIRCIKPNMNLYVDVMENEFIVNQLRSLGVLQTCEVLKLGMPTRLPYKDVIDALQPIISKLPTDLVAKTEQITMIACILWAFDVQRDLYKLGRTRVFFRAGQFELIERILQSTKENNSSNSSGSAAVVEQQDELIARIKLASGFKQKAEKMGAELSEVLKLKEVEISSFRQKVTQAVDQINKAPVKRVEVPVDLAEVLGTCDGLLSTVKSLLNDTTVKGNLAVTACNRVLPELKDEDNGNIGADLISTITTELDKLNSRVAKTTAKHSSTMIRFDALLGRHDRVRDVASSLEDVLNSAQHLIVKAGLKIVEINDGGMRCDLPYAEEKAKSCEDVIQQVSFKLEGVGLDLKEIFDVFGAESTRGGVDVGLRLVKATFASEIKILQEIKKELELCLLTCDDALELAESVEEDGGAEMIPGSEKGSGRTATISKSVGKKAKSSKSLKQLKAATAPKPPAPPSTSTSTVNTTTPPLPPATTTAATEGTATSDNHSSAKLKLKQDIEATTKLASQSDLQEATAKLKEKLLEAASCATSASSTAVSATTAQSGGIASATSPSTKATKESSTTTPIVGSNVPPTTPSPTKTVELTEEQKKAEKAKNLAQAAIIAKNAEKNLINIALATANRSISTNTAIGVAGNNPHIPLSHQGSSTSVDSTNSGSHDLHHPVDCVTGLTGNSPPTHQVTRRSSSPDQKINPRPGRPMSVNMMKTSASSVMAGHGIDMSFGGLNAKHRDSVSSKSSDVTHLSDISRFTNDAGVDDPLPEGWKEHYDPTTKRPFYVHKATKARQWKRPTTSSPDPKAKRKARRSSLRSDASGLSDDDNNSMLDGLTGTGSIVAVDRFPNQFSAQPDRNAIVNLLRADLGTNSIFRSKTSNMAGGGGGNNSLNAAALAARNRTATNAIVVQDAKMIAMIKRNNLEAAAQSNALSVSKMDYIGLENKTGYLMKKSSILGRWRKRWFVLEGGRFEYFNRPQDEASGNGKSFLLTPESLTSYTSSENCFCLKSNEDSNESSHWYLVAKDESDMDAWMVALNSHIHMMFAQENAMNNNSAANPYTTSNTPRSNAAGDLWEEGVLETTFWRVVKPTSNSSSSSSNSGNNNRSGSSSLSSSQQRISLAIRTLPKTNGPRTGEGVTSGEVLECVQTLKADFNTYLRLWADRGWMYEKHPKARYAVLTRLLGDYVEENLHFVCVATNTTAQKLTIYSGPSYENTLVQTSSFSSSSSPSSSAEVNTATNNSRNASNSGEFVITVGTKFHTMASFMERIEATGRETGFMFYKLSSGQGWVPRRDMKTGAELIRKIAP